jgi:hypothetical protein
MTGTRDTAIRGEADCTMGLLINRVSTRSLTERIAAPRRQISV